MAASDLIMVFIGLEISSITSLYAPDLSDSDKSTVPALLESGV
jgi:NADH:ubiquinone oxidoreductase subunit 2 (subunit N)